MYDADQIAGQSSEGSRPVASDPTSRLFVQRYNKFVYGKPLFTLHLVNIKIKCCVHRLNPPLEPVVPGHISGRQSSTRRRTVSELAMPGEGIFFDLYWEGIVFRVAHI